MKFPQRELQATPAPRSAPGIDEAATLLTVIRAPSACAIDFFETPNSLTAGFEEGSKEIEKRKASKVAARRTPSLGRIDRLEQSLYWLLSAATLVYLFLELIGF